MGTIIVPDPPCGSDACAEALRGLATAAEHRDVIGMAKGLLMSRGCSADAAFDTLRRASMRENVKVWRLASKLVYGTDVHDALARPAAGNSPTKGAGPRLAMP